MSTGKPVWQDEQFRDISKAVRPIPRRVKRRPVREAGRHYVAYDLHSLINAESKSDTARPGHMFG